MARPQAADYAEKRAAITAAAEAEDLDTLNHLLAVAAGRQLDQRVEVDNAWMRISEELTRREAWTDDFEADLSKVETERRQP